MDATVVFLVMLVVVGYLVVHHGVGRGGRSSGLAGGSNVRDRDAERMLAELAAADRYRDGYVRTHAGGTATREVGVSAGRR